MALGLLPDGEGFGISRNLVAHTLWRANRHLSDGAWTAHDLRRSALTRMAALGIEPIVLGHVANHRTTTKAGTTLGVYVQYVYEEEKRKALDLWADRLEEIVPT
jgi:integrase